MARRGTDSNGSDFFRKVIALEQKYTTPKITIENTLQTNGTLLTEDWSDSSNENHFLVGISIDGPANLHYPYCRDKGVILRIKSLSVAGIYCKNFM